VEMRMAGESIVRIKEKEQEASEIVRNVKDEALKIVLAAREKKSDFIAEKDGLLKEEEEKIKQRCEKELSGLLKELDDEEQKDIEKINALCKENLDNVVQFISNEIVKE
jgi:vacuolar-type H+-ATPase subunit H